MSFQAVRAVFETPVIDALAALSPTVPCYVDNQAFSEAEMLGEYATVNLQWGSTTSRSLSGNDEKLSGSLIVECYTAKNTGPARAQEMITPVMRALNDLNSCKGYEAEGAVGWVGDMTGPAFFALTDTPFYMVRLSVAISAKYNEITRTGLMKTSDVKLTNPTRRKKKVKATASTKEVELVTPVSGMTTQEDANQYFDKRIQELEDNHDDQKGHNAGSY